MDWSTAEARLLSLYPDTDRDNEGLREAIAGRLAQQPDIGRFFTNSDSGTRTRLQQLLPQSGMQGVLEDSCCTASRNFVENSVLRAICCALSLPRVLASCSCVWLSAALVASLQL